MTKLTVFKIISDIFYEKFMRDPRWNLQGTLIIENDEIMILLKRGIYLSITIDNSSMEFTWGVYEEESQFKLPVCKYALMEDNGDTRYALVEQSHDDVSYDSAEYAAGAIASDVMPMFIELIVGHIPRMEIWDPIEYDCSTIVGYDSIGEMIADIIKNSIDDDDDADIAEVGKA